MSSYPLFLVWPRLAGRVPRAVLGDLPSPLERLPALEAELERGPFYVKRDDLSSPVYGGNKVRTLETLFGDALARGAEEIVSVGAFGSNHALATALHAPRVGLRAGAIVCPQPASATAYENFRETVRRSSPLYVVPHWCCVPAAVWAARAPRRAIMAPGGATPSGALGYVSGALELALQLAERGLEPPRRIYVGIGSSCTTAGLLVGFQHAARLGIGFRQPPELVAVRVTPWPVTSRLRVAWLARRTARFLAELAEEPSLALDGVDLTARLVIDGSELGRGYGQPTAAGVEASGWFARSAGFVLDTTYSAKSAAGFLRGVRDAAGGPALFWSTKSTAAWPAPASALVPAPSRALRWLGRAEASEAPAGLTAPRV